MSFYQVSLGCEAVLPLGEKKKYIDSMYQESASHKKETKRNQGFAMKFNHSIGFKPVVSTIDSGNMMTRPTVESPGDYRSPYECVLAHIQTPLLSNTILDFYIEDKKMEHADERFSYEGKVIAEKWCLFLQKVFPSLTVTCKRVEAIPSLSLKEFTLQYFYRNLDEEIQYTLEFSAGTRLNEEELEEITSVLNTIASGKVTIAQFPCDTCSGYSDGAKPYHTEIVYLTNYDGGDESAKLYETYGNTIYQLKETEDTV